MQQILSGALICYCISALLKNQASALEVPPNQLSKLASRQFREREIAQGELLEWARATPASAMDKLLWKSRSADDPEVRERCLGILRALVFDEYMKEGEGYLGISLKDEISDVPGEFDPRGVIRVIMVQPGSPAGHAGLRQNDLIVAINGEVWQELLFRANIRMMKPNAKVDIRVLREGGLLNLKVKLSRRPLAADIATFPGQAFDYEATELAAKEAYFKRWLSQRKSMK